MDLFPVELLERVYMHLNSTPLRWKLAQTCKTMYSAFVQYNEAYKRDILRGKRSLRYAANWGDPILTQIALNPLRIKPIHFIHVCASGNMALMRWMDAYAVVNTENPAEMQRRCKERHFQALAAILRISHFKNKVPVSRVDKVCSYLYTETSDVDTLVIKCAGQIYVYGQHTLFYPSLKAFLTAPGSHHQALRRKITTEFFYAGMARKGKTFYMETCKPFYSRKALSGMCDYIVSGAIGSPNRYAFFSISVALGLYSQAKRAYPGNLDTNLEEMLALAIVRGYRRGEQILQWIRRNPFDQKIRLDLEKVWIRSLCSNKRYIDEWALDLGKCLVCLLDATHGTIGCKGHTCQNLHRHVPDIFRLLTKEQVQKYKNLGVFCPKCLRTKVIHPKKHLGSFRCKYCMYSWMKK
uniref:F-box domain-containing protein n=1 Tax=Pithovirus LCPAC304 TaxID=2506594 RepID=A0A481Z762_9VIRU|nr:MAG: hypothetical protein LCPAC304_00300 [Pithovirus LCPAC304]